MMAFISSCVIGHLGITNEYDQATACMSRIGSILLEFGMAFPKSHSKIKTLFQWLADHGEPIKPMLLLKLRDHHDFYLKLDQLILTQDKKLKEIVDQDERSQVLKTIHGVGNLTASRCISDISNVTDLKNGRHLAVWISLVPRQFSTGGKPTLLGISKRVMLAYDNYSFTVQELFLLGQKKQ
jgi:transposase